MKITLRRVLNIVFTLRTLLNMVSASRRSPQGLLKKPTTVSARELHPHSFSPDLQARQIVIRGQRKDLLDWAYSSDFKIYLKFQVVSYTTTHTLSFDCTTGSFDCTSPYGSVPGGALRI